VKILLTTNWSSVQTWDGATDFLDSVHADQVLRYDSISLVYLFFFSAVYMCSAAFFPVFSFTPSSALFASFLSVFAYC
jgi:hypothetical protein